MTTGSGDEIRLLIVEDVPQVAQYIRNLLTAQSTINSSTWCRTGPVRSGRSSSSAPTSSSSTPCCRAASRAWRSWSRSTKPNHVIPVIVLTVPQQPVNASPGKGIHGVLSMPFSGFDLLTKVQAVHNQFHGGADDTTGPPGRRVRPEGRRRQDDDRLQPRRRRRPGGRQVVLIDGSLQFGDLRALLKVPGRRAVDPRPADRPDPGVGPARRPVARPIGRSTSSWRRRASRWPRWSAPATWRRSSRCCAASTR